ncbi:MAG: hypothetical protein AUK03_16580 [Anaerolineae bacterium CG2_30_64_16]|nr:MAG: hypothetical protein AUK03_16580 [Anaerolineae bacterium CG2_30_64_16]
MGTDRTGVATLSGAVKVSGANNTVGGATTAARNICTTVRMDGGTGNRVQGNYIGVGAAGERFEPRGYGVIFVNSGLNHTIGGSVDPAGTPPGNVISGNGGSGILFSQQGSDVSRIEGVLIQGNLIGTDVTGAIALPNRENGVFNTPHDNNTIGGTAPGLGNVIAGNVGWGVLLRGVQGNLVQGNRIGTDLNGTAAVANNSGGVKVMTELDNWKCRVARDNVIGGPPESPDAGNLISGNYGDGGVMLSGASSPCGSATDTLVQGNRIGTDASGNVAVGNVDGVTIFASHNVITENLISGQSNHGIYFYGPTDTTSARSQENRVENNQIGLSAAGASLGNGVSGIGSGIYLKLAENNTLANNTIAYHRSGGVVAYGSQSIGNTFTQNSIFSNKGGGIVLVGANNNQKAPVIGSVSVAGGSTTVVGTLTSVASTTFRLEFFSNDECDAASFEQGKTYLGSVEVTTDADGKAPFQFQHGGGAQNVTATATNLSTGDTSGFSACGIPSPLVFKVENDGDVYADGTYQTPAADFAEWWPLADSRWQMADGKPEPGDVLALGPDGGVMLAGLPGAGPVIGVHAAQPGFLAGGSQFAIRNSQIVIPVALVGVVPLKVSAENGPIQPGDLLALSSTPGVAARAMPVTFGGRMFHLPGSFFAKALEPFGGPGIDVIRVLLVGQ